MKQSTTVPVMTERSVISVHTKPEISKRLESLASLTRRSKSFLANDAIERYLEEEEAFILDVQAGMSDAEAGRTITTKELKQSLYAHISSVAKSKPLA